MDSSRVPSQVGPIVTEVANRDRWRADFGGTAEPLRVETGGVAESRRKLTLTVEEAAGLLGISRTLAYELITRGELPHVRLGRRILVSQRALESMVDGTDRSA